MSEADEPHVKAHYTTEGLLERIVAALGLEGAGPGTVAPEALAPVDHFHTRGATATAELFELGQLPEGAHVLDIGGGLGGPARYLATRGGHRVTLLELVPELCRVAEAFTRMTGLSDRVRIVQGSALSLPFADASFDAVWTMQAQMNVRDKRRFYAEAHRVLAPGGRFVFQDIFVGNGDPLDFPVPWASRPELSFLAPPDEVRALLAELGFEERTFRDVSAAIVAWRKARPPRPPGPPPPGTHLLMGADAAAKRKNSDGNLDAGRIAFMQGVFDKPESR